jgi:hypothetical protein
VDARDVCGWPVMLMHVQMLYKATEPPPVPSDLALFKLTPHLAGDHLMPEGQALHLRRARDAVQRLLTVV